METAGVRRSGENSMLYTSEGERVFILPETFLAAMYDALKSVAGAAANSLIFYIGVKAGRALAKDALKVRSNEVGGEELKDSTEALAKLLERFGIMKLEAVETADGKVRLVVSHPASLRMGVTGRIKCHFERGLVMGLLEAMTGRKVRVNETDEDGKCIFEVQYA